MDRETGKPRGFAHVQFDGVEGAAAAIAKNGSELMGRDLFIDSAQERPQSGATPGGRQQRGAPLVQVWIMSMFPAGLYVMCLPAVGSLL